MAEDTQLKAIMLNCTQKETNGKWAMRQQIHTQH